MAQVAPEDWGSPTTSKRKTRRRSWFSPNKMIKLELAVECPNADPDEEVETLLLTHFTKAPRVDFGKVRVGKSRTRRLCVRNPHDYEQEVLIEKFPFKKNFTVEMTQFVVSPGEEIDLRLIWEPEDEGNCREMVLFQVEGVYRLQTILFGQAEAPPKPRRVKKWVGMGVGKTSGKTPFNVLQQTNGRSSSSTRMNNDNMGKGIPSCNTAQNRVKISGNKPRLSNNKNSLNTSQSLAKSGVFVKPFVQPGQMIINSKHDEFELSSTAKVFKPQGGGQFRAPPSPLNAEENGMFKVPPSPCKAGSGRPRGATPSPCKAQPASRHYGIPSSPHNKKCDDNLCAFDNTEKVKEICSTQQSPSDLLPLTPRRTTFNKGSPRLPNTPVIEVDSPRRRKQSPVMEGKENTPPFLTMADLAVDSPPSTLRRSNTYTKLNSSLSPKPRKLAFNPTSPNIEEVDENNASIVDRRRSDSSVANSSDSSCMFEDSLMNQTSKTPPEEDPKFFPPVVEEEIQVVREIVSEQVVTTVEMKETVEEITEVITCHESDSTGQFKEISRDVNYIEYQTTTVVEGDNSEEFFLVNSQELHDSLMHYQGQQSPDVTSSPGDVFDPNVSHEMVVSQLETVKEKLEQRRTRDTNHKDNDTTANTAPCSKDDNSRRSDVFGRTVVINREPVNSKQLNGNDRPHMLGKTIVNSRDSLCSLRPDVHPEGDCSMVFSQTILRKHGECEFKPPQTPHIERITQKDMPDDVDMPDQCKVSSLTVTKSKSCFPKPDHDSTRIDIEQQQYSNRSSNTHNANQHGENSKLPGELGQQYIIPAPTSSKPGQFSCATVTKSKTSADANMQTKPAVNGIPEVHLIKSDEPQDSLPRMQDCKSQKSLFQTVPSPEHEHTISSVTITKNKPNGLGSPTITRRASKKLFTPPPDHCGILMPETFLQNSPSRARSRSASPFKAPNINRSTESKSMNESRAKGPESLPDHSGNKVNRNCGDSEHTRPGDEHISNSENRNVGDLPNFVDSPLRPAGPVTEVQIEGVVPLPPDSPSVFSAPNSFGVCSIDEYSEENSVFGDNSSNQNSLKNSTELSKTSSVKNKQRPKKRLSPDMTRRKSLVMGRKHVMTGCKPPTQVSSRPSRTAYSAAKPPRKENPSAATRWRSGDSKLAKNQSVDRSLTRTQQLRRQAALASMGCSASVKKAPVEKIAPLKTSATTGKKLPPQKGRRSLDQSASKSRALMKGVAQSKLTLIKSNKTALPKHPLPFAAKNMYYDERWMEKQERGFVRCLNFILTPPDEYFEAKKQKVDAGALCMDSPTIATKLAPTKETLSFKAYAARRRLNRLRRAACKLFQSEDVVRVIHRLEVEIESKRLLVRKDRKLHADLGIKQKILDMVLSYNPLWLRIGLETVYGEILPVQSNVDVYGISRFVVTRFLGNPDIASQYSHPTVPHLYKKGYDEALAQFTLKKFLLLVYFLDKAKQSRLIDYNPCLFCCDSDFKTSRDLLLIFSRDYLSGEGDITRHLAYLGMTVTHVQTALDEYDFAVMNLASDLRDGVRLSRVVELLIQDWSLSKELRVPAISRLQKIHNIEVGFRVLAQHGLDLELPRGGKINPRDISDGHREKTLHMLWNIIFRFQVTILLNEQQLREEVQFLRKNLQVATQLSLALNDEAIDDAALPCGRRSSTEPDLYFRSKPLSLLLKWCRAVCAYYDMKVENFTVSFSDGRALCYLVHHYHPTLLPLENICAETTSTYVVDRADASASSELDDSFDGIWTTTFSPATGKASIHDDLLSNERHNFKFLHEAVSELGGIPFMVKSTDMSGTIPDEKVVITYVSYLCSRLLDIRLEVRAARTIQVAWRRYAVRKCQRLIQAKHRAACIIQNAVRLFLLKRRRARMFAAAVLIQSTWRRILARKKAVCLKKQKHLVKENMAATKIQAVMRMLLCQLLMRKKRCAVIRIQAFARMCQARMMFLKMRSAAVTIQRHYRFLRQTRKLQRDFLEKKRAAITLQKHFRGYLARKHMLRQHSSALVVQRVFKGYLARTRYSKVRDATKLIQNVYRRHRHVKTQRDSYLKMKKAALTIQHYFHSWQASLAMKRLSAVTKLQAWYRMCRCRQMYIRQRQAAVLIQSCTRMHLANKNFCKTRKAAVVIQRWFRCLRIGRKHRQQFLKLKKAVVIAQRFQRARLARKEAKCNKAATAIQAVFRRMQCRRAYLTQKNAATSIQAWYRCSRQRQDFCKQKYSAILIQRYYRAHVMRRQTLNHYQSVRRSAIIIQSAYRGLCQRHAYQTMKSAALCIQTYWRSFRALRSYKSLKQAAAVIQTRFRANRLSKKVLKEFRAKKSAAITIQSRWRGVLCYRQYQQQREAAIVIQAYVRGFVQKRQMMKLKYAAIALQKHYRALVLGRQVRKEYEKQRKAVITLQATCRGCLVRKTYKHQRHVLITLQAHVRGVLVRKHYIKMRNAAVVLQRHIQAYLVGKRQYLAYHIQRGAVITLQSAIREWYQRRLYQRICAAAVVIQSHWRGRMMRKEFVRKKTAVSIIQTRSRAYIEGKNHRCHFLKQRKAAVIIQSAYRGLKARQRAHQLRCLIKIQAHVRMCLARREFMRAVDACVKIQAFIKMVLARKQFVSLQQAAVIIQTYYRAHHMCRQQRQRYLATRETVINLQARIRGYLCRKSLQKKHDAATKIQAAFRAYRQRALYVTLKQATLNLQSRWRARTICKEQRAVFVHTKRAVVTLQSAIRGYKVRREMKRQNEAAAKIQSMFLMYRTKVEFKKLKLSTLTLQHQWRLRQLSKQVRSDFLHTRRAVVILQAAVRGYLLRQTVRRMHRNAGVIQTAFRAHLCRKHYINLKKAAVNLQCRWRARMLGKQACQRYIITKNAVITIQAAYKGYLVRREVQKQKKAIVTIQSKFRAYCSRQEYCRLKAATVCLQRRWRARCTGKQVHRAFLMSKGAAITIQASYRAYSVRRELGRQNKAAVVIQAVYKSYRTRHWYQKCKAAVTVLQKHVRGMYCGQQERNKYLQTKKAAVVIQACFRRFLLRKEICKQEKSACIIQSCFRTSLAVKQYSQLRCATVCMQRRWRALCLGKTIRCSFLITKGAAITIQAAFRAFRVRKELKKQHTASVIIQSTFRAFVVRKRYAMLRSAAVCLQTKWRSWCLFKKTRLSYLVMLGAIITLQAAFRGHLLRNCLRKEHQAAVVVQSMVRAYLARVAFQKTKQATRVIQCHWRACCIGRWHRREFLIAKGAAMTIQAAVRGYCVRNQLRRESKSVVKIQSAFRMFCVRRRYLEKRNAAIILQRRFQAVLLGRKTKQNYLLLKRAAVIIQSTYRGQRCKRELYLQHKAATTIQAAVRGYCQRRYFVQKRCAVVTVQTRYRAVLEGRRQQAEFQKQKTAAMIIQSYMRGAMCRRELRKNHSMAVVIQNMFRSYRARKKFLEVKKSTITIQRWYRNCRISRNVKEEYLIIRRHIVQVQSAVRGYIQRKNFSRLLMATVTLQRWVRAQKERHHFVELRRAVRVIQTSWRVTLHVRQQAARCIQQAYRIYKQRCREKEIKERRIAVITQYSKVVRNHLSVIRIQRCFRRYRVIREARQKLHSVLLIQRWMQAKLQRLHYLKLVKSISLLQGAARVYLKRRTEMVIRIQAVTRGWLERRHYHNRQRAAKIIQSVWRGYKVRCNVKDRKVRVACQRVQKATAEATEEKKLCNRTTFALDFLLGYRQISYMLKALMHLEVSTRLSWMCCERMVQGNAVHVIFHLIQNCNRSIPHMDLIKYSVEILLNLSKYVKTQHAVYEVEDSIETLVKLMVIFREKGSIFTKTCTLLGIICHDEQRRQEVVAQTAVIDKLRSVHSITRRKHALEEKRQIVKNKMAAARSFSGSFLVAPTPSKRPKIHPDWMLRRQSIREIEDPLAAINFVMNTLHLKAK